MGGPPSGAPLLSVQVLRALAALAVVVHHAGYDADTIAARSGTPPLEIDRLFDWAFGVHLFFVISGFIMLRTARGFGRPGATWHFLGRRVIRIVPLYWLMTSLVLLGGIAAPSLLNVPIGGWALILGSYLFIPARAPDGEIRPVLGQGWTLDYEMFFYVVLGVALLLPRRWGLATVAVVLVGLVLLGRVMPPSAPPLVVWTGPMLVEFLLGIGIGLATERGLRLGRAAGAALAIFGLVLALALGPLNPYVQGIDPVLAQGVPATLILSGGVLSPPWRGSRLVLALAALGDASYSLYLAHPFAIRLLRTAWGAAVGGGVSPWLFFAVAIVGATALGIAVYRLVERPMTVTLNRLFPAIRHHLPESAASSPV